MMRWLVSTLFGVWELAALGVRTRFDRAYWRWRNETAFGTDPSRRPPRRERIAAALEYARWVHRMKRRR